MKLSPHTRTARGGFTLVEMLVVIAIIGILVGLISAAVIKALGAGNQTVNMTEIRKMTGAHQAFLSQYKVTHIPSRIVLCKYVKYYNDNPNNPLYQDSIAFLNQVWPRLGWKTPPTGNPQGPLVNRRIDWDGKNLVGLPDEVPDAAVPPPAKNVNFFELDGGQCLVFFLGGIPEISSPGTKGFWTNPLNPTVNPANPNAPTERTSPFYEFKNNRLLMIDNFYYYLDAYGTVNDRGSKAYAYFSSYGRRNDYNKYSRNVNPALNFSDCRNQQVYGTGGTWPLQEADGRYLNPESFQIISAGANQAFGLGTAMSLPPAQRPPWFWSGRNPGPNYAGSNLGSDDQSNFHSLVLGAQGE